MKYKFHLLPILAFLILVGVSITVFPKKAEAAVTRTDSCYRNGRLLPVGAGMGPSEWNNPADGYRYRAFRYEAITLDLNSIYPNAESYLYTGDANCVGTWNAWGSAASPGSNTVTTDSGPVFWGNRKPIDAWLGLGGGTANGTFNRPSDAIWKGASCGAEIPYPPLVPPNAKCDFQRASAFVDDAGSMKIGSSLIWCTGIVGRGNTSTCPTNIETLSDFQCGLTGGRPSCENASGAASLLTAYACSQVLASLNFIKVADGNPGNSDCSANGYPKWYLSNVGRTSVDLSPPITKDGYGDLNNFSLYLDALNTQPGGFGTNTVVTYRYPLNESSCQVGRYVAGNFVAGLPSPIFTGQNYPLVIRATNTGTFEWRTFYNHKLVRTNGSGSLFSPPEQFSLNATTNSNPISNGEYYDFAYTFSPASTGSQTRYFNMYYDPNNEIFGSGCSFTANVQTIPSCEIDPRVVQVNENRTITITVGNTGTANIVRPPANLSIIVRDPNGNIVYNNPDAPYNPFSIPPGDSGSFNFDLTPLLTGKYTFEASIAGVGIIGNCDGTATGTGIESTRYPYVSSYGADVFAGGSFGSSSCSSTAKGIAAFSSTNGRGAGTQLAAFALGTIYTGNFSSAKLRTGQPTAPLPENGLTFANTSLPPGTFGGSHCITDYFSGNIDTTPDAANALDFSTLPSGNSYYQPAGGILEISNPSAFQLPKGRNVTVYVDGDVVITQNIQFNTGGNFDLGVNRPQSFFLIVKGNINIAYPVTNIDGIFVSQPSAPNTKGIIATCTGINGSIVDPAAGGALSGFTFYNSLCSSQLRIGGQFIARRVKFLRTFGTLTDGSATEHPFAGVPNCVSDATKPTCAAEVFTVTPNLFLSSPSLPTTGASYESYLSLPPLL